jgi:intracellular septation protein
MAERRPLPAWFGWAVDGAPGVAFIITYLATRDTRLSTWVIVIGSLLALAASLIIERKVRPILAVTAGLAVVFGGWSLFLRDFNIIKMKMTIVDTLLGLGLFAGLAMKKNPLKMVLGATFALSDHAWTILAMRYGAFWLLSAAANEIVRRTQSDHTWVIFRGAALGVAVVFALAQTPFLLKHARQEGETELPPPPDLGV